jgi:lipopolysaccharide/colanic/teichoic acid biosynthesis glycosyltransferase
MRGRVRRLAGRPLSVVQSSYYRRSGKRVFDVLLALFALVALAPFFLFVSLAIKVDSRGPIFFRQVRCGLDGTLFKIFKFRSMVHQQAGAGQEITVANDPRVTRMGSVIRKYKIDELPQLINVVRGDMSIVGPRPEVSRYIAEYSAKQRACMLSVRPGITDYASILFRDESAMLDASHNPDQTYIREIMPQKFFYYRYYVEQITLMVDIQIIFETAWCIVAGRPTRRFEGQVGTARVSH